MNPQSRVPSRYVGSAKNPKSDVPTAPRATSALGQRRPTVTSAPPPVAERKLSLSSTQKPKIGSLKTPITPTTSKAVQPPSLQVKIPEKKKESSIRGETNSVTKPSSTKIIKPKGTTPKSTPTPTATSGKVATPVIVPDVKDEPKKTGELVLTVKDVFDKGEIKCTCLVGTQIWVGGGNGQLVIYDRQTFQTIDTKSQFRINDQITAMSCINVRSKNTWVTKVWTGYMSGKVIIYNASNAKKEQEISCHNSPVTSILQAGDVVWTSSMDGTIRLWDVETLMPASYLDEHSPIRAMVLIAHEGEVWTASEDNVIKVRQAKDGIVLQTLEIGQGIITLGMVYTNDHVWSAGDDGKIRIFDASTKALVRELKAHEYQIPALCATDKQVWSSSNDKVIHIFDAENLKGMKKIRANNVWITNMIPIGNENIFAVCSDKKIRVWRCAGEPIEQKIKTRREYEEEDQLEMSKNLNELTASLVKMKGSSTNSLLEKKPEPRTTGSLGNSSTNLSMDFSSFKQLPNDTFDLLRDEFELDFEKLAKRPASTKEIPPLELSIDDISQLRMNVSNLLDAVKNDVPSPVNRLVPVETKYRNTDSLSAIDTLDPKHLDDYSGDTDSEYDDTSNDDGRDTKNKALLKEYESEIASLRNQLQESTNRANKYKSKLKTRNQKLQDRDTEITGIKMKYKHMQDELYHVRSEMALVHQETEKLKMEREQYEEEKDQIATRLGKLHRQLSDDHVEPGTDTGPTTMRMLDKLLLKVEMESSLTKFRAVSSPSRGAEARTQEIEEAAKLQNQIALHDSLSILTNELGVSVEEIQSILSGLVRVKQENSILLSKLQEREAELAAVKQVLSCSEYDKSVDGRLETLTESVIEYAHELELQFTEREKVRKIVLDVSRTLGLEENDDIVPLLSTISRKIEVASIKHNLTDIDGDINMESRHVVAL